MGFNPFVTKFAGIATIILTIYGLLVTHGIIPELIPGVF